MSPLPLDYERRMPLRRTFGHPQAGSVTAWLIFLNSLIYVIDTTLGKRWLFQIVNRGRPVVAPMPPLTYWGHFSEVMAIYNFQFWRFITFQFLHASISHLVWNMIGLFFFGPT